jgi:uncharacterized protein (DUF302 family)
MVARGKISHHAVEVATKLWRSHLGKADHNSDWKLTNIGRRHPNAYSMKSRIVGKSCRSCGVLLLVTLLWRNQAVAADGLISVASRFSPQETSERLVREIGAAGMTLFARVDHAAGGASIGLPLRPTELLIFGNPRGGTPLMQARQTLGIDLPLRALVYQDAAGIVWVAYDDPDWLAKRHGLGDEEASKVIVLKKAIAAIVVKATQSQ